MIGRFSFDCRKAIGFAMSTLHDWLKKLSPLFHPIRGTTKTNCGALAHIFPRFESTTYDWFESCFDWLTGFSEFFVIG